jgi:hypothetical protein
MNTDYTVFLHVNTDAGQTIANADAPPLQGGFPTSLWQPGDRIEDEYVISKPQQSGGTYTLELGWYDSETGARLMAVEEGDDQPLPNAALSLPIDRDHQE